MLLSVCSFCIIRQKSQPEMQISMNECKERSVEQCEKENNSSCRCSGKMPQ